MFISFSVCISSDIRYRTVLLNLNIVILVRIRRNCLFLSFPFQFLFTTVGQLCRIRVPTERTNPSAVKNRKLPFRRITIINVIKIESKFVQDVTFRILCGASL
jgi:hypothetical protein